MTPMAKRPRITISNTQKKALYTQYLDPSSPKRTLTDTITQQQTEYRYTLSSSTTTDILSTKYTFLDDNNTRINQKKKSNKSTKQDILEKVLGDQAIRFNKVYSTIIGDLLQLKAIEFWQYLPEYQGLEYPTWSNSQLAGFKSRFNFHYRKKAGEAGSVEITDNILL